MGQKHSDDGIDDIDPFGPQPGPVPTKSASKLTASVAPKNKKKRKSSNKTKRLSSSKHKAHKSSSKNRSISKHKSVSAHKSVSQHLAVSSQNSVSLSHNKKLKPARLKSISEQQKHPQPLKKISINKLSPVSNAGSNYHDHTPQSSNQLNTPSVNHLDVGADFDDDARWDTNNTTRIHSADSDDDIDDIDYGSYDHNANNFTYMDLDEEDDAASYSEDDDDDNNIDYGSDDDPDGNDWTDDDDYTNDDLLDYEELQQLNNHYINPLYYYNKSSGKPYFITSTQTFGGFNKKTSSFDLINSPGIFLYDIQLNIWKQLTMYPDTFSFHRHGHCLDNDLNKLYIYSGLQDLFAVYYLDQNKWIIKKNVNNYNKPKPALQQSEYNDIITNADACSDDDGVDDDDDDVDWKLNGHTQMVDSFSFNNNATRLYQNICSIFINHPINELHFLANTNIKTHYFRYNQYGLVNQDHDQSIVSNPILKMNHLNHLAVDNKKKQSSADGVLFNIINDIHSNNGVKLMNEIQISGLPKNYVFNAKIIYCEWFHRLYSFGGYNGSLHRDFSFLQYDDIWICDIDKDKNKLFWKKTCAQIPFKSSMFNVLLGFKTILFFIYGKHIFCLDLIWEDDKWYKCKKIFPFEECQNVLTCIDDSEDNMHFIHYANVLTKPSLGSTTNKDNESYHIKINLFNILPPQILYNYRRKYPLLLYGAIREVQNFKYRDIPIDLINLTLNYFHPLSVKTKIYY